MRIWLQFISCLLPKALLRLDMSAIVLDRAIQFVRHIGRNLVLVELRI